MATIRAMHYINQFFAGVGGEEKADVPVNFRDGAVGPGKLLLTLCGDTIDIVVTAYCGDDYFSAHQDEALAPIQRIAKDHDVKLLIAGPAFLAGRYGAACAEVCHTLSTSLNIECISAMHLENPGVELYRQHKDMRVFFLPTTDSVAGMKDALSRIASFITRIAAGSPIGSANDFGYIPRGYRKVETVEKTSVERAVDMLLDKVAGRPVITEIPVESLEEVQPAAPVTNLATVHLALVTTSGVVKAGNPDGFKVHRNTQWRKYNIENLNSMQDTEWDVRHGGYNNVHMLRNPNYGVPLDACRELERDRVFARLHPSFYTTPGINGLITVMQRLGKEIVADMKKEGVDAAILVST